MYDRKHHFNYIHKPYFVNPKINNFRSFFGKNAALTRFSGLPLPVPSVC